MMSYRKRFVEWCQRPSRIKISTFNPRNVVILITAFVLLASSATIGTQQLSMPPPYIAPEDIETLIITMDTTLTEDYFNTTIVIAADGITLDGDGHQIIGPGSDVHIGDPDMESDTDPYWMEELNETSGILLEGRTSVTVKNCRVTGFTYGVFLNGSEGNILQGNTATGNGMGFMLESSDGNSLRGNIANDNGDGFWVLWSDGNSYETNTANDNAAFGYFFLESSQNTFEANTANNNDHFGFWSCDTSNDTFRENTANGNNYGFHFSDSFGNTIQGNTANNNGEGFGIERSNGNTFEANTANNNTHAGFHVLFSSSNNTLTGNTASNNEYGICYGKTDEGSPNNRIYHNNFINNLQHIYILTTVNTWDDGSPYGGNFWSDYAGVDADGDGIGDTPYVINKNNVDRFPLMAPISVLDTGTKGGENDKE